LAKLAPGSSALRNLKGCDDASLDLLAGFASSFARLPFEGISGLLYLINEGRPVHDREMSR
jgi:hypothetical protein